MKFREAVLLAALIVGAACSSAQAASPISGDLSFSPNSTSGPGTLDVLDALAPGSRYTFTGGSLTFDFTAPAYAPAYAGTWNGSYQYQGTNSYFTWVNGYSTCILWWCTSHTDRGVNDDAIFHRPAISDFTTPYEAASVSVGSSSAAQSAPYTDSGTSFNYTGYDGRTLVGSWYQSNDVNGTDAHSEYYVYYTDYYSHAHGYGGDFTATVGLDSAALASLNQTGSLAYNLVLYGGAELVGVSMSYLGSVSPIPEPEGYALMLAGLGVVAVSIRRRAPESSARRITSGSLLAA